MMVSDAELPTAELKTSDVVDESEDDGEKIELDKVAPRPRELMRVEIVEVVVEDLDSL